MGKKKRTKKKTIEFEADFDISPKLGCEHGRLVGQPCPHCMGMNKEPPQPAPMVEYDDYQGEYRRTCIHCNATWQEVSPHILQEMTVCRNCRSS